LPLSSSLKKEKKTYQRCVKKVYMFKKIAKANKKGKKAHYGLSVVKTTICGEAIIASLFVFLHHVAKVDLVL